MFHVEREINKYTTNLRNTVVHKKTAYIICIKCR